MTGATQKTAGADQTVAPQKIDAVVVGAGFSGLRMLHELRELGLSAVIIEAGTEVGGTWYWNRYPGARTDSEAWYYCYSFSPEIQEEWSWSERFAAQPEVLRYLQFVADRLDLRKDIHFSTRVESAVFDEDSSTWLVTTDAGQQYDATYFIAASGGLSQPYLPDFPGVNNFKGQSLMTQRWPKERVDFGGKRVAVIGTGASGIQIIPEIAQTAAQLTVFQRTPNYVLPARNHTLSTHQMQGIRANYPKIWDNANKHVFGFGMEMIDRPLDSVPPAEVERIFEAGWETGGFRYIFETFSDMFTNDETNDRAAEFIRNKIRTIVHDPETAEALCPKGYPLGGKRPPLGHYYYETYNRDNVKLVDLSRDPLVEITETGVRTEKTDTEFDIIVYATGFDAVTGALTAMDVRGRHDLSLESAWKEGVRTYLGLTVEGFPNFFMIYGPQSVFANVPIVVELTVTWISRVLTYLKEHEIDWIEPTTDAEVQWNARLNEILYATLIPRGQAAGSWFFGNNIPGKASAPLFDFSGVEAYTALCNQVADDHLEGFALSNRTTASV